MRLYQSIKRKQRIFTVTRSTVDGLYWQIRIENSTNRCLQLTIFTLPVQCAFSARFPLDQLNMLWCSTMAMNAPIWYYLQLIVGKPFFPLQIDSMNKITSLCSRKFSVMHANVKEKKTSVWLTFALTIGNVLLKYACQWKNVLDSSCSINGLDLNLNFTNENFFCLIF